MPSRRTVQISEPFPGALRFQVIPKDARADPATLSLPGLQAGTILPLLDDPELGITAIGTDLRFLFEPPTGTFRLTREGEVLASGQAQYDPDRKAQLRVRCASDDTVHGLGGAVAGNPLMSGTVELTVAPSQGQPSSLCLFLIRRGAQAGASAGGWLAVLAAGYAPVTVGIATGNDGYIEITWPGAQEALALDVVFAAGSLPEMLLVVQRLIGAPQMPPAALLGTGTEMRVASPADWGRQFPKMAPFDFVTLFSSYQDGPRPFTFNRSFSESTQPLFESYAGGSRVLLLTVEPAVFVESGNRVFQQGLDGGFYCQTGSGVPFRGTGPGGDSVFPDLVGEDALAWWQKCHGELLKQGAGGFFVQGEEFCPSLENDSFRLDMKHSEGSHLRFRGAYPRLMAQAAASACAEAQPTRRPAVLADAAAAGGQQAGGVLLRTAGEPTDVRETVERLVSLGLSGFPLAGFSCAAPAKHKPFRRRESFVRRIEVGSLMPIFFLGEDERHYLEECDAELRALVRKHVRRRMRLLPYLQTLLHRYVTHGEPLLLPSCAGPPEARPELGRDQFMLGPHLLAAPVYEQGARMRSVYLPAGTWYEFETGRPHKGGDTLEIPVEMGYYPLFIRAGSVLPLCPVRETVRESLDSGLMLEVYPGDTLFGRVILDDGVSSHAATHESEFTGIVEHNGTVVIEQSVLSGDYAVPYAEIRCRLPGPYRYATVDGERREGVLENLMREERLVDMYSHDVPRTTRRLEFHYSGSFQFS